jgi:hypothetical protein
LIDEIHAALEDGGIITPTMKEVLPGRIRLGKLHNQLEEMAKEARALKGRFVKPTYASAFDVALALKNHGLVNWIATEADIPSDLQEFFPEYVCLASLSQRCEVCGEEHLFAELEIWNNDMPEEYLAIGALDFYMQGNGANVGGGWEIRHETLLTKSCEEVPYRLGQRIQDAIGGSGFWFDSGFDSVNTIVEILGGKGIELIELEVEYSNEVFANKARQNLLGQYEIRANTKNNKEETCLRLFVELDSKYLWDEGIEKRPIWDAADCQISGLGWDIYFFVEASNLIPTSLEMNSMAEALGGKVRKALPEATSVELKHVNAVEILSELIESKLGEHFELATWDEYPDFGSASDWEESRFRALHLSTAGSSERQRTFTLYIQTAESDAYWMKRKFEADLHSDWHTVFVQNGFFVATNIEEKEFTQVEIAAVYDAIKETTGGNQHKRHS